MAAKLATFMALAATIVSLGRPMAAVCSDGQIAVGIETIGFMVGPGGPGNPQFSGFEMTNNCKLISQNGITDDNNQVCAGDYFDGASVTCNDSGNPISAVDTTGNSYTCSETEDTSCNETSGQTTFTVVACCSRN